jgi:hypothetical protein
MLGKILSLPVWLISRVLCSVSGILKLIIMLIFGVIGFVFNHITGTIFGALAGLLFGRKHVGLRFFTHHRKSHA